jgi:uncharacterized protein (TIGR00369 family)
MNTLSPHVSLTEAAPQDTAFKLLVEELANPPFHDFLKPEAVAVNADGSIVVRLPCRAEFVGRRGSDFVHGGVIAALIDVAAHAALSIAVGRMVPTVDLRIDYLRPARGSELIAFARILGIGRSLGRADVQICSGPHTVAVGRGVFSTAASAGGPTEFPQPN